MDLHTDYMPSNPGTDYPTKDAALLRLLGDILEPTALFGWNRLDSSGLDYQYFGGSLVVDGALTAIAAGSVTLTNNQTNYVERTHAGVVSANTTGWSADKVPVATAVTSGGAITTVTDKRPLNLPPVGRLAKSVAGGAGTTVLTADEARSPIIEFTGALTGNRVVEMPNTKRTWIVLNNTSGAFTLVVKVSGQTGVELLQGDQALVYGNGTDIVSGVGEYRRTVVFTSSGTWTKPAGLRRIRATVVSAGGGGGGVSAVANAVAGGGGSGGMSIMTIDAGSLGATETVTVGAGGAAGANTGGNGGNGGTSSFGSHCSATGGTGGGGSVSGASGYGGAGSGSGGDINVGGNTGSVGVSSQAHGGTGGQSPLGGGAGGAGLGAAGGVGAVGGGGGGAGSAGSAHAGGVGGDGIVIVEEFF